MAKIDCENLDTTMGCLAHFYATNPEDLYAYFLAFDLEAHLRRDHNGRPPDEQLEDLLEKRFGLPVERLTTVCWFHLSRTRKGESFEAGILPLGEVLPQIWQMLFELTKGTLHHDRLRHMEKNGVSNSLFNLKTPEREFWGPYAMLVKEISTVADQVGNSDFLGMPEIIEDLPRIQRGL